MFFLLFLLNERRFRIREAQKHMDCFTDLDSDLDPQHRKVRYVIHSTGTYKVP
jgi:hypothetical protein